MGICEEQVGEAKQGKQTERQRRGKRKQSNGQSAEDRLVEGRVSGGEGQRRGRTTVGEGQR